MSTTPDDRHELLRGTLDLLILRTLVEEPMHGHAIAKHIQQSSGHVLKVETGSLYPALHRLEARGWLTASWRHSDKGKRAKYYRLTRLGRKHLPAKHSRWETFAQAMRLVLEPSEKMK